MILVGTSGYSYPHWRGLLYPDHLGRGHWLERYAEYFPTVELNATFYKLATARAVERWRMETPPNFLFACKGSQYLTHRRRLLEAEQGLERFFSPIRHLGEKLGPILWQLPPQMAHVDIPRLRAFVERLPGDLRHVFEFRHPSWYTEEVAALLDAFGIGFCEHDLLPLPPPRPTGGFRYLRFHGASARYEGRYGKEALRPFAVNLLAWRKRRRDAYVYFNNDTRGHALYDAADLGTLLGLPFAGPLEARLHGLGEAEGAAP